jgi:hypothetical protein
VFSKLLYFSSVCGKKCVTFFLSHFLSSLWLNEIHANWSFNSTKAHKKFCQRVKHSDNDLSRWISLGNAFKIKMRKNGERKRKLERKNIFLPLPWEWGWNMWLNVIERKRISLSVPESLLSIFAKFMKKKNVC